MDAAKMIQGARTQYRAAFMAMAAQGGAWCFYRGEAGPYLSVAGSEKAGTPAILEHVEAMSEETMAIRLAAALPRHY